MLCVSEEHDLTVTVRLTGGCVTVANNIGHLPEFDYRLNVMTVVAAEKHTH